MFFDMKREAKSFYAEFSICPPPRMASAQTTGLISASPESQPSSSDTKTPLTDFSLISAHASGA